MHDFFYFDLLALLMATRGHLITLYRFAEE